MKTLIVVICILFVPGAWAGEPVSLQTNPIPEIGIQTDPENATCYTNLEMEYIAYNLMAVGWECGARGVSFESCINGLVEFIEESQVDE
jgi:hypothetical protein